MHHGKVWKNKKRHFDGFQNKRLLADLTVDLLQRSSLYCVPNYCVKETHFATCCYFLFIYLFLDHWNESQTSWVISFLINVFFFPSTFFWGGRRAELTTLTCRDTAVYTCANEHHEHDAKCLGNSNCTKKHLARQLCRASPMRRRHLPPRTCRCISTSGHPADVLQSFLRWVKRTDPRTWTLLTLLQRVFGCIYDHVGTLFMGIRWNTAVYFIRGEFWVLMSCNPILSKWHNILCSLIRCWIAIIRKVWYEYHSTLRDGFYSLICNFFYMSVEYKALGF